MYISVVYLVQMIFTDTFGDYVLRVIMKKNGKKINKYENRAALSDI